MNGPRFAIYFIPAPESALYQFGCTVLGYDCYSRRETTFPPDVPVTDAGWLRLTGAPRRYGFHATIKAPFFLAPKVDPQQLERAFEAYVASTTALSAIRLRLDVVDDFIALVPCEPSRQLARLVEQCVTAFDSFRAPLTQGERQRRLQAGLNLRQVSNLERWGYPYVFEDFRFHMTLTGTTSPDDRQVVFDYLQNLFHAGRADRPFRIDRLCLVRQDWPDANFRVVRQALLGSA